MNKALVVGINKYRRMKLNYCVNDAKAVEKLLSHNGDDSVNFKVTRRNNVKTKSQLKALLVDLFKDEADTVLFYFAGHGRHDYFGYQLVTPDYSNHDWGLPVSQLMTIVRKSPAKNKIVILDCCYAGGVETATSTNGMATYLHEGVTILASSKPDQKAQETAGHGVFTNLLIEALKGGAADLNGNITAAGVYAYIDKAMGLAGQRPVFKTNISEFVPIRTIVPPVPPEIMQLIPVLFPTNKHLFKLNPSFEDTNDPTIKHDYVRPFAKTENVKKFKALQKLQSVGLVEPAGAPFMYFAAMKSKACKLTPLGKHYWRLANDKSI
jgi:hypothetical protein